MTWTWPRGTLARDGYAVCVDDQIQGWRHTRLCVLEIAPGQPQEFDCEDCEFMVIPLEGGADLDIRDPSDNPLHASLAGRENVFAGPTDVAYLAPGSRAVVTTDRPSRIAFAGATVSGAGRLPAFHHLHADDVPVERRGAGSCSRLVRNFGTPGVLEADSLIACEVITPAANWSSYPPHKHDVERPGEETSLEEIYYYEVQPTAGAPQDADPLAYQRVYASDDRPIDVLTEVRSGDVVLIPYGWHGPSMATPTADLYYLNVMAGPGVTRAWLICDDPAHGWVRDSWRDQQVDPRIGGDRHG